MAKPFCYLSNITHLNLKALGLALLAAALVGCDAPGTARLKELCETEGFPEVYQQVSAEGYYDEVNECGYAIRFFVDWDYEFVECRQNRNMPLGPNKFGLYRMSKVPKSSGLCDEYLCENNEKVSRLSYKKLEDAGMCFSVRLIESSGALYGLFNGESYAIDLDNIVGSKIVAHSMYIKAMN